MMGPDTKLATSGGAFWRVACTVTVRVSLSGATSIGELCIDEAEVLYRTSGVLY
jgi:hypothetical protein